MKKSKSAGAALPATVADRDVGLPMKILDSKNLVAALISAMLVAGCSEESPEQQLKSAKEYLQKNDTKSASIQIKNALQKNPDFAEARYLLGSILLKDGDAAAAEIEFRKALSAKYPNYLVVPDLASALMMMDQSKKLVDEFGKTRLRRPAADARLQTTLAAAYSLLEKPELAKTALDAALSADPEYSPALIERARQKAGAQEADAGLLTLEKVLSREPQNADAWKAKGDILLYSKGLVPDALLAYRKSIEVKPNFGPGHIATMVVLMRLDHLDEATKQLEQLKRFAASNPETKYIEAQLAYRKKDYKLARELSQQLLRLAPGNSRFLEVAGRVELQLNSLVQAEVYLVRALQAEPDLVLARQLLIVTYLRSGQPANALTVLSAAPGKEGVDPTMLALAGEAYLQSGNPKKAEEYFSKALKLDPGNAGNRTALAVAHLADGQAETAFSELQAIAQADGGTNADLALISAHLVRKEYDRALAAIDRLEAKQPDKPLAANLRGRVRLSMDDRAAARKSFERALSIDPNYFAALASLAALDMADNKPDEAKKRFEQVLSRNPESGQALLALARLAAARGGGNDEVTGLVVKAVQASPSEVAPRLLLIELLVRSGDLKQASTAAQSAVAALPKSPELLEALGRVQQMSGDVNQAIATYGKLIALQSMSPQPYLRLAEAQAVGKNNLAAEQSLRRALEIKPDLFAAQRGLIMLALDAKRYQDAVKMARAVQQQRPKSSAGYLLEGDIASLQKNFDAAAVAYRSGLQQTNTTDLATKLHSALRAAGKTSDADKFATTWVKDHPKDGEFLSYLGDTAMGDKEYPAAEKFYLAVLQIKPNHAMTLNNLAWVSGELRRDGAIAYAEKATRLAPDQPDYFDTLAKLLAEKQEYAKAIDLQTRALQMQPSNARLRLNLAKIYLKANDKTRAKAELETLRKLGGQFSAQAEVSSLMKSL